MDSRDMPVVDPASYPTRIRWFPSTYLRARSTCVGALTSREHARCRAWRMTDEQLIAAAVQPRDVEPAHARRNRLQSDHERRAIRLRRITERTFLADAILGVPQLDGLPA